MHTGTHLSLESDSDMLSGLLDEMSKDGMLLPERCINLGSIVGQGRNEDVIAIFYTQLYRRVWSCLSRNSQLLER